MNGCGLSPRQNALVTRRMYDPAIFSTNSLQLVADITSIFAEFHSTSSANIAPSAIATTASLAAAAAAADDDDDDAREVL